MTESTEVPSEDTPDAPEPARGSRGFYARWWFWLTVVGVGALGVLIGLELKGRANDDDRVVAAEALYLAGECAEVRDMADQLDGYRFPLGFGGAAARLDDEVQSCDDFEATIDGAADAWAEGDCDTVTAAQARVDGDRWPFVGSDAVKSQTASVGDSSELCSAFSDAAKADRPSVRVVGLLEFDTEHDDTPLDPLGLATETIAATEAAELVDGDLCDRLDLLSAIDPVTPNFDTIWSGCAALAAGADSDSELLKALAALEILIRLDGGAEIAVDAAESLVDGIEPERQALLLTAAESSGLREQFAVSAAASEDFCVWLIRDDLRSDVPLLESCVTTLTGSGMHYARAVLTLANQRSGTDFRRDVLAQVIGHPDLCAEPQVVWDVLSFAPPADFELPHLQACVHSGLDLGATWFDHLLTLAERYDDPWAIDTLNAARPQSGTVLENNAGAGAGQITIENRSPDIDIVAVLEQPGTRLVVYLHPGGSHTFYGVPDGTYQLRWSGGRYWMPETGLFRHLDTAVRSPSEIIFTTTYFGDGSFEYSINTLLLATNEDPEPGFESSFGVPIDQAEVLGAGL